jgi:hypothetical protein
VLASTKVSIASSVSELELQNQLALPPRDSMLVARRDPRLSASGGCRPGSDTRRSTRADARTAASACQRTFAAETGRLRKSAPVRPYRRDERYPAVRARDRLGNDDALEQGPPFVLRFPTDPQRAPAHYEEKSRRASTSRLIFADEINKVAMSPNVVDLSTLLSECWLQV